LKKLIIIAIFFLFIAAAAMALLYHDITTYEKKPARESAEKVVFVIPAGQKFESTLNHLYSAGIIESPTRFKLLARIRGYDKKIQAGEYLLSANMPPRLILKTLVDGKVNLYRFTIPEGYHLTQIAQKVSEADLGDRADFLSAATDRNLLDGLNIRADTSEGYLFPDTYHFPKGVTSRQIITTMVNRFWSVFTEAWKKQSEKMGFSVHEIVTLASIIEKETGAPFERPLISSVFHNRLKRNMRLETDPTVIYGIKNFDGNLTRKHLKTYTPYNTYLIRGLPPGPIASPGSESLKAALFPAKTRYLFFVSKKDTTHYFSTSLSEHNRAVRKYQLGR
jgi:UPF0755 protein